jgi:hypothetical protein
VADNGANDFAPDYFSARDRFLGHAARAGARVAHFPIGARGPDGRELSVDTAYIGTPRPRRLLIVLSGTHGIEGFAGSAIQQRWLMRHDSASLPADTGCLLVHAVNPFGFAWQRRTNEHNVDINRNAIEHFPGPANPAYAQLNDWLNPPTPPRPLDAFWIGGARRLLTHGLASVKQAIAGGQYQFPQGLFYGGMRREESIARLDDIVSAPAWRDAERVVAIDIHTGLGRFATYKLLVDFDVGSAPYRTVERWFGAHLVNGNQARGSVAYRVSGGLNDLMARRFARAQIYPAVLEFGTVSLARMLGALRQENRAYFHAGINSAAYRRAHEKLRKAFYPGDRLWRQLVLTRGERVLQQAQQALNEST